MGMAIVDFGPETLSINDDAMIQHRGFDLLIQFFDMDVNRRGSAS